ncbi:hypothetical protein DW352_05255 [Pseudolabrys taiwanensis]|uniref:Uncharacterized protein n=1 Tax=Pseudolabrys taiwanensis TaxID=331696 RepID=A0A345ZST0_9HYPH|nr:hypothetical protein [Pseudolabrys taiwanensis]AXK79977.1 hypothetical protein DW352_05255 [Pseudolabrys taiwanensis]
MSTTTPPATKTADVTIELKVTHKHPASPDMNAAGVKLELDNAIEFATAVRQASPAEGTITIGKQKFKL